MRSGPPACGSRASTSPAAISCGADRRLACGERPGALRLWRNDRPMALAVAASGDAIFAIDAERTLQRLDRASGAIRRTYAEWPAIDGFLATPTHLYLSLTDPD